MLAFKSLMTTVLKVRAAQHEDKQSSIDKRSPKDRRTKGDASLQADKQARGWISKQKTTSKHKPQVWAFFPLTHT